MNSFKFNKFSHQYINYRGSYLLIRIILDQNTNLEHSAILIFFRENLKTYLYALDYGSNLENYTINNTSTTGHNTRKHDATRVQHDITRDNTSTLQRNTSKTRPNAGTKEARASNGFYFAIFVTKLYIFLISFRNS